MTRIALCVLAVLLIIFTVPFAVYGTLSAFTGAQPPGGSNAAFFTGVLVSKLGTALTFVLVFNAARGALRNRWPAYASMWWLMFAFGEIGQAIGPSYSWPFAIAGIVSETIYLPLSALVTSKLLLP